MNTNINSSSINNGETISRAKSEVSGEGKEKDISKYLFKNPEGPEINNSVGSTYAYKASSAEKLSEIIAEMGGEMEYFKFAKKVEGIEAEKSKGEVVNEEILQNLQGANNASTPENIPSNTRDI
jgi:hypothetical protein